MKFMSLEWTMLGACGAVGLFVVLCCIAVFFDFHFIHHFLPSSILLSLKQHHVQFSKDVLHEWERNFWTCFVYLTEFLRFWLNGLRREWIKLSWFWCQGITATRLCSLIKWPYFKGFNRNVSHQQEHWQINFQLAINLSTFPQVLKLWYFQVSKAKHVNPE